MGGVHGIPRRGRKEGEEEEEYDPNTWAQPAFRAGEQPGSTQVQPNFGGDGEDLGIEDFEDELDFGGSLNPNGSLGGENEPDERGGWSPPPTPVSPPQGAHRPPPERPMRVRRGELIGSGAFGRVYLGLDELSGAIVAVKEITFEVHASDFACVA